MEILIAAGIAVLMILAFAFGIETGMKICRKSEQNRMQKQRTESAESEEETKRQFEEDQKAFAQCMNYSWEKAYGNSEV